MRGPAWLPRSRAARVALAIAAALTVFGLVVVALEWLAPTPRGPDSSAFATAPAGLAAYADLLADAGHRVERRRTPLAEGVPPRRGTLVVLDARAVEPAEADAIAAWVRRGGRLVAGGETGAGWLGGALGGAVPLREPGEETTAGVLAPAPETAGVRRVRVIEGGTLENMAGPLPILGEYGRTFAAVTPLGRGRVVLLADASPLQNRGLALEDNAAFGLALAGRPGEPVTFLETVHGYASAGGLAALPERARWALLGLLLAGAAFAWSHARRIGPPEDDEPALPPPRGDYVDALAGTLVRTRRPAAVAEPLRRAAREELSRRAGLPAGAGEDELREAAARLGLGDAETAALLRPPEDLDGALAAGRALAAVTAPGGRGEERR